MPCRHHIARRRITEAPAGVFRDWLTSRLIRLAARLAVLELCCRFLQQAADRTRRNPPCFVATSRAIIDLSLLYFAKGRPQRIFVPMNRPLGRKFTNRQIFQLLFHVVLWTAWLGTPFIFASDSGRFQHALALLPISLTHIPLFLFNTEWLIPRILRKKGVPAYLLSLVLLVLSFAVLQYFMREWMADLGKRTSVAVSYVGKVKTGFQMTAIGVFLAAGENLLPELAYLGYILLYAAAILTIWSMFVYLKAAAPELRLEK